jgi:two-component system, sensor histidine kinase and response regulator
MPGMSGIELARLINQDPLLSQTHLVVLISTAAAIADGAHPHVSAFLSKPVRSSQLYDCLVKALVPAETDLRLTGLVGAPATRPPAVLGRLLVTEDNATNQLVARAMLSQLGYRVDIAASGLEALAALDRTSYAAVLMDCQMPEMDGYTATAAIRRSEIRSGRHTPIIAVTAGAFEGDQQRCLAAGMDDYISKPIKLLELQNVLNKWVIAETQPPVEHDRRVARG